MYEQRLGADTDIRDHLEYFVETCVELDAKHVIELGVRNGNSTVAWLYGLDQTEGHLWSVDPDGRAVGTIPPERWTFVFGLDTDQTVIDQLPNQVDVVFIDTTHYYQHTLYELELYVPRVRPGGRVLLHDTELEIPDGSVNEPPFPVKRAVAEYCEANDLRWTNRDFCWGLATVFIPEEG